MKIICFLIGHRWIGASFLAQEGDFFYRNNYTYCKRCKKMKNDFNTDEDFEDREDEEYEGNRGPELRFPMNGWSAITLIGITWAIAWASVGWGSCAARYSENAIKIQKIEIENRTNIRKMEIERGMEPKDYIGPY